MPQSLQSLSVSLSQILHYMAQRQTRHNLTYATAASSFVSFANAITSGCSYKIRTARYKIHSTQTQTQTRLEDAVWRDVYREYYWITQCPNCILSRCAVRKPKSSKQIISAPLEILSLPLARTASRLLFWPKFLNIFSAAIETT